MMRSTWKTTILACLVCLPAGAAPARAGYFQRVHELDNRGAEFYLPVRRVFADSPAARAGLLEGDRIVGVDGLRVRTPSEYMFLRYRRDTGSDLVLTVLRGDALVDVPVRNTAPIRRGGFSLATAYDRFYELLAGWDVKLDGGRTAFTRVSDGADGQAGSGGGVTDLLDSFGVRDPRLLTRAGRLVPLFPARGWESLARVMATGRAEEKAWGAALLNVYLRLRFEEYADAADAIAAGGLSGAAPDPFLGELAAFYGKLCKSPPEWGIDRIWDRYGVDLDFFVVCYPYPVSRRDKSGNSFAFDPQFQGLFDRATIGLWVDDDALGRSAAACANGGAPDDPVGKFVGEVKAGLLDPANYGGRPFRSLLRMKQKERATVLAVLERRLKERSDERVLTAFALLYPVMASSNIRQFRRVYGILYDAGERERACANAIIERAVDAGRPRLEFGEVIFACEEADRKPGFYDHMLSASPAFRYRARIGTYGRRRGGVVGPEIWAAEWLSDVAAALESPIEVAALDRACGSAKTADPAGQRAVFGMLTRELAGCPRQSSMDQFVALAKNMPPGEVLDAANFIFGYHNGRMSGGCIDIQALFTQCFAGWELERYEKAAAELAALDLRGEDLKRRIGALFIREGTPSVCLLLAGKLRAAGEEEAAAVYVRKVVDLYENLIAGYRGAPYRYLHRQAYRDMVSAAGFSAEAAVHRAGAMVRATDGSHVLAALDDFRGGRLTDMIDNLGKSLDPGLGKDAGPYVFDGRLCAGISELRAALICHVVRFAKLSGARLEALAGLEGMDMAPVLAELQKSDTESAPGPVTFAVDTMDGRTFLGVPALTSIVVGTSYADIRLPLTKIQSVGFPDERRLADVQLRNGDIVNGTVDLTTLRLDGPSGSASVPGGSIKLIVLHTSQIDRFRAFVMRKKSGQQ